MVCRAKHAQVGQPQWGQNIFIFIFMKHLHISLLTVLKTLRERFNQYASPFVFSITMIKSLQNDCLNPVQMD